MRKVMIIENDEIDFNRIKEKFLKGTWEIIPENYNELGVFFSERKKVELHDKIEELLKNNLDEIGIIILDINLFGKNNEDTYGLDGILKNIRTMKLDNRLFDDRPQWPLQVPIIAYSKWGDIKTKSKALGHQYHVHTFIEKEWSEENVEELLLTAEALSSVFAMNVNMGGFENYFEPYFDKMKNLLISSHDAIESKLDNVNILIEGKFDHIKESLNIILNVSLKGLSDKKQESLLREFGVQLKKTLGENQFYKIQEELSKPSVKHQLKVALKNGNFSDLIDFLIKVSEELKDNGIIDIIPGGKIIGFAFSAIVKILSN